MIQAATAHLLQAKQAADARGSVQFNEERALQVPTTRTLSAAASPSLLTVSSSLLYSLLSSLQL